ncbi:MAG TPA: D-alanyl-D-alanine carboxypeptidase/D-alanyl-D-alanine-endopeptidase [Kofleriaceae bacterium]|jgi:D-alanyl-D-alanine carboxypeptidase/D-alanyl-D-alanine-endopeptidase (penicillin-binding protein 4)
MMTRLALVVALCGTAFAEPPKAKPPLDGAHARVTFGQSGQMRAPREIIGRREQPLTAEEATAKQIEKLLRGPLRYGVTGIYVADARSGEALFAVNADDLLNPASNVKMISTATALELMGADFRYSTRLLGPEPDGNGTITGDMYLLGTWDPTLVAADLDQLADQLVMRGVKAFDGNLVVGPELARDGLYHAEIPIDIRAGAPGEPPTATAPPGVDLVTFAITAKTAKTFQRPHLTFAAQSTTDATGHVHVELAIAGTIGKGGAMTYPLVTAEHTAAAASLLRAAMRARQIAVNGDVVTRELGDFIGDAVTAGGLPVELARHDSATLGEIVTKVNKWSINWLADRVIETTAALAARAQPSMPGALDAMYAWLGRHTHVAKTDVLVDSGSGLSYHTRISARELVAVVRDAAGFTPGTEGQGAQAWLGSLSIGGTDGTLGRRFRTPNLRGLVHAKTGTLATVIALSGVLDTDPQRPLAFSIVTNGDRPLSKAYVRKAHEQIVALLASYAAHTAKAPVPAPPPAAVAAPPPPSPTMPDDAEEPDFEAPEATPP